MAYISITAAWEAVDVAPTKRKPITKAYAHFLDLVFVGRELEAKWKSCRQKPGQEHNNCCPGHRALKLAWRELDRRSITAEVVQSTADMYSEKWWRDQGILFVHGAVIIP